MGHLRVERIRALAASLVVALHMIAVAWHATMHERVPVPLPRWETAFIALVVVSGPFLAAVLLWGRRGQAGALLLGISMMASLAHTLLRHYLLSGPENVAQTPDSEWTSGFRLTALALVMTGSAGLAVASWLLRATAPPAPRRARRAR